MKLKYIVMFLVLFLCVAHSDAPTITKNDNGLIAVLAPSSKVPRTEITCLADNIYFEARGEPVAGQYAVAQVTVNRFVNSNVDSICKIVYARGSSVCQFSWTCSKTAVKNIPAYLQAVRIAKEFLVDGHEVPELQAAWYFHADTVHPAWADTKHKICKIGHHTFYHG